MYILCSKLCSLQCTAFNSHYIVVSIYLTGRNIWSKQHSKQYSVDSIPYTALICWFKRLFDSEMV